MALPNSLSGADLNVTELTDVGTIQFYAKAMADQINKSRADFAHANKVAQKRVRDLEDWIADIIIETSAQGSSLLEVHVIDPAWTLFQRDVDGICFIDVDEDGFLWPPIEVTYPQNLADSTWRLAQCRPSTDLNQANVVLVFEDKIASELREHQGPRSSNSNETRAEFIQRLIKIVNDHPTFPTDVPIRFVPLLPKETFTGADMSGSLPLSATQSNPPPARKKHKKPPASPASSPSLFGQPLLPGLGALANPVAVAVSGAEISIQDVWGVVSTALGLNTPHHPISPPNISNPVSSAVRS